MSSDFAVGRGFVLTPSLGVLIGRSTTDYSYSSVSTVDGFNPAQGTSVAERITAGRFGGDVGLGATWSFVPRWSLYLDGRAAFLNVSADLSGNDCSQIFGLVTSGVCGANPGPTRLTTVSDTHARFGFRSTTTGGVTWDVLRWASVTLGGFLTYDTAIPGVINPNAVTAGTAPAQPPARLTFDDRVGYGGFLTVRFRLGGV